MSTLSDGLAARDKATNKPWEASLYLGGAYVIDNSLPEDAGKVRNIAEVSWHINNKANATVIISAPDALDWIAKALPFVKLDLERRRFEDYDDGENKTYGDRDIATLTALIAEAEGTPST